MENANPVGDSLIRKVILNINTIETLAQENEEMIDSLFQIFSDVSAQHVNKLVNAVRERKPHIAYFLNKGKYPNIPKDIKKFLVICQKNNILVQIHTETRGAHGDLAEPEHYLKVTLA